MQRTDATTKVETKQRARVNLTSHTCKFATTNDTRFSEKMRDNANDAVRRFKSREVLDYISRVRTSMISQIIKSRELSSSPLQAIIADITSRRRKKECSSVVSVLRSRHAKKGYCT